MGSKLNTASPTLIMIMSNINLERAKFLKNMAGNNLTIKAQTIAVIKLPAAPASETRARSLLGF